MKNTFKILTLTVGISILAASCSKKLDTQPYNSIVNTTAFNTAARCLLALNGVYDAAQSGVYDPLNGTATADRGYPFGAAAIEQSEMRGEDMINLATFYAVTYQNQYNSTSPNNVNMWKELYALINKANLSIDGFRNAGSTNVLTPTVAAQYEAECRFLRAMAHHELVINFARPYLDGNGNKVGVPYRDFPVDGQAAVELLKTKVRDSVVTVYRKILIDLDYAEANLPANGGAGVNTIRATKAAAIALKMRVKLHMGDWAGVLAEGNKLIPTVINPAAPSTTTSLIGPWALTAAADGPFTNNLSTESIFSIRNDVNDNPGTNAALSRLFGSVTAGGRGLVSLSPTVYNLPQWTCSDKRKILLTIDGTSNISTTITTKFSNKYKDYGTYSDYAPYIRFAEVFLMQAEAEARNNAVPTQRGVDLLNMVRNRSIDITTPSYTLATFADKNALITAILAERRIEFAAEGKRWGDIHRLAVDPVFSTGGIPAKLATGTNGSSNFVCNGAVPAFGIAAIAYSDYRFLWPIPAQEINTNPIVSQNPSY